MVNKNAPKTLSKHVGNQRRNLWQRIAPAVGLFFLAPLVAEYLLGNVSISMIAGVFFLAPMYGGGAIIIREVARRAGRGWPTIILLALAYGVLQPGLLDHSLFNPSYGGTENFQSVAYIPALGIGAYNTLAFTAGHAVWSISVPIALIETLVPNRRTTPWLGNVGLIVTGLVFLLGSALIFQDHLSTERFLPSVPQLISTAAVVVTLIGMAFAIGRQPGPAAGRGAPNPWLVGVVAFVASSLFFARSESWMGVAFGLLLVAVMTVLITLWSRREGWGAAHRLALAGGALLTYSWGGFVCASLVGNTGTVDRIGNVIFALGAIILLILAARKTREA